MDASTQQKQSFLWKEIVIAPSFWHSLSAAQGFPSSPHSFLPLENAGYIRMFEHWGISISKDVVPHIYVHAGLGALGGSSGDNWPGPGNICSPSSILPSCLAYIIKPTAPD